MSGSQKKVLLVDDSALMRRVLCDIIESTGEFKVEDKAADGIYALEYLEKKQYDVVVGPVANDDLALLFRQFEEGFISIETLTKEMTFKQLTNQYSFHTQRAVNQLKKAGVQK